MERAYLESQAHFIATCKISSQETVNLLFQVPHIKKCNRTVCSFKCTTPDKSACPVGRTGIEYRQFEQQNESHRSKSASKSDEQWTGRLDGA